MDTLGALDKPVLISNFLRYHRLVNYLSRQTDRPIALPIGLVRLRVRRATTELEAVFEEIASKIESEKLTLAAELDAPFSEITDDDIDRLFSE